MENISSSPQHVDKTNATTTQQVENTSPTNPHLKCRAVVWRVGEIFGEFGISFQNETGEDLIAAHSVEKWELRVVTDGREAVFQDELTSKTLSKVVKLKASSAYLVNVRCHSSATGEWGPWSEVVRTRTFAAVATSVSEIGEDYVRVQWDRPLRDTTLISPEKTPEANSIVSEISQFELRIVREQDMVQEFCDEFATGIRTYTLHELRPGTAYIVFVRHAHRYTEAVV